MEIFTEEEKSRHSKRSEWRNAIFTYWIKPKQWQYGRKASVFHQKCGLEMFYNWIQELETLPVYLQGSSSMFFSSHIRSRRSLTTNSLRMSVLHRAFSIGYHIPWNCVWFSVDLACFHPPIVPVKDYMQWLFWFRLFHSMRVNTCNADNTVAFVPCWEEWLTLLEVAYIATRTCAELQRNTAKLLIVANNSFSEERIFEKRPYKMPNHPFPTTTYLTYASDGNILE